MIIDLPRISYSSQSQEVKDFYEDGVKFYLSKYFSLTLLHFKKRDGEQKVIDGSSLYAVLSSSAKYDSEYLYYNPAKSILKFHDKQFVTYTDNKNFLSFAYDVVKKINYELFCINCSEHEDPLKTFKIPTYLKKTTTPLGPNIFTDNQNTCKIKWDRTTIPSFKYKFVRENYDQFGGRCSSIIKYNDDIIFETCVPWSSFFTSSYGSSLYYHPMSLYSSSELDTIFSNLLIDLLNR